MGTRNTTEDYGDGNWINPQIQAENRAYQVRQGQQTQEGDPQAYDNPSRYTGYSTPSTLRITNLPTAHQPGAASVRLARRKPAFSLTRRLLCLLLALIALVSGLSGTTAYWAHTTLVDARNFAAITESIAYDQDFQTNLASAVTEDIMSAPALTTYLGDGNSTTWYGSVQNWLYEQTRGIVDQTTHSLVTSEAYPRLWAQVIEDTHAYNFAGESRPSQLDLSALYDAAGTSVQGATGLAIDTNTLPGRTITLDTGESFWPINSTLNTLIALAGLWQPLLMIAAVAALVGFALWPGNRLAYLAFTALCAAGCLWLAGLLGGGASVTAGQQPPTSHAALIFLQKLSEVLTGSFATYHYDLALKVLVAAVVLTLLALLSAILGLTARATTALTR